MDLGEKPANFFSVDIPSGTPLLFSAFFLILFDESLGDTGRNLPVFFKFHGKFRFTLGQGPQHRGITKHFA
jgi:hypothetical protein